MDSPTVQIFGDKKLKRKLIQSVNSVKKKIKSLREDKADLTSTLQETFQPITAPLNSLLKHMDPKNDLTIKRKRKKKTF